jgi:AcrR family transcriptional regulator
METVRHFKQKRAAATYEALLDAAHSVFARRGFEGAQTPEIAAEAGVSTGAFYRYFEDKRQIFLEVVRRMLERSQQEILSRLDPSLFQRAGDRRANVARAIDLTFEEVERGAGLERVYLAQSLVDDKVAELRVEYERRGLDVLTALVEALVPRKVVPRARAAALVIQLATVEAASERAGLRPRVATDVPAIHVKAALREMVLRYLFPE